MSNKYTHAVFIGRFQPFTDAHASVVVKALETADNVIIVCGSATSGRSTRNPYTYEERVGLIWQKLNALNIRSYRIIITGVSDHLYNLDAWITEMQQVVHQASCNYPKRSIALAGMKKDHSSFYLNLFPQWDSIAVEPHLRPNQTILEALSATHLREADYQFMLDFNSMKSPAAHIHQRNGIPFELAQRWQFENDYKKKWGKGPHMTADSVVVQSGMVLLIQRGAEYCQGQWALPGGFIEETDNSCVDASIRELREETKLKVPEPVLRGSIVKTKVYDDPFRSQRARIITVATYFRLRDGELPKVKGADDAQDARWFPLAEVKAMRANMFEDHYDILEDLVF